MLEPRRKASRFFIWLIIPVSLKRHWVRIKNREKKHVISIYIERVDKMRIALNEVDPPETMSMNYLTMDVLKNMMENTEDLNQFADQVTEQIREMIGCRTVVLMRSLCESGEPENDFVSLSPKTHLRNISALFFDQLAHQMATEESAIYWSENEKYGNLVIQRHLIDFNDLLILPLDFDMKRLGYLVCLDLDHLNNLSSTIELLRSLTGFIGMVLQNTLLSEQRNRLIEERSKRLVNNELFLDALANVVPVGILKTDKTGKVVYFNKKVIAIFSEEEGGIMGRNWVELVKDPHPHAVDENDWQADVRSKGLKVEFTCYNEDLKRCWYVLEMTALSASEEKGYVGVISDISDRKVMEIEMRKLNEQLEARVHERTRELKNANVKLQDTIKHLQHAQEQLVQSEKMASLGRLVSGVAHEINTPVGVGVTTASYLEEEALKFKQTYENERMRRVDLEHFINLVSESSELLHSNLVRASELTRSFKEVAVDQTIDDKRSFDLCAYIEEILISLNPKLRNTRHHINLYCDKKIEINSYPSAFSQIITNFFMNSLIHGFDKFYPGLIEVHIIEEEGWLKIVYEDNGKGILKSHLSKIYEPFFTTNRSGGNSGLGLHIVYNLVTQKLKGKIHCETRINDFTRFIVEIPRSGSL